MRRVDVDCMRTVSKVLGVATIIAVSAMGGCQSQHASASAMKTGERMPTLNAVEDRGAARQAQYVMITTLDGEMRPVAVSGEK
ncbi:hypothetical protein LBMAG48_02890 [Phycisphaerae bacterium]|jgi:hypothetical protein|nr:hypothetical protein LBMAG48_02890 [Phycisphaerae bacterium]